MNNNKNSLVTTVIIVAVVGLALGYFLSRSAPKSAPQNSNQTASMIDHHGGSAVAANNEALDSLIGKPIPDIQLADKDGKTYAASDFKGKNIVLFFNEGLMCYPACWNQIAAFGSDQRFNNDQTQAISVVVDSARDWEKAIAKMPQLAKANTMFDINANASRQLGILNTASSMHRGSLPGHTYIVLNKEGVVKYVLDDPNMALANDVLAGKIKE